MGKIVIRLKDRSNWLAWNHDVTVPGHTVSFSDEFSDADVLINDTQPISMRQMNAATHLKGIVRPGVGFDNVPQDECRLRGIVMAYTPNAPSRSVAEFTVGLMIVAGRGILGMSGELRNGRWERYLGHMLAEQTLGVIGLGRIGKRVVGLARPLFRHILGNDPVADTTFDEIHGVVRMDLPDLLQKANIVTMHIPKDGNEHFFQSATLKLMKDDVIFLNTSRGGIVDEDDLFRLLQQRPRMVAVLDVFAEEPYGGKLAALDNVILTPHAAAMTRESRHRMETQAMEAALAILAGVKPRWVVPTGDAVMLKAER